MKFAGISAAAIAACAFIATPASADTLALSGHVDYQCALTLSGQNAGSLNLRIGDQTLGSYTIKCNDPDGFTMNIASANGSKLVNGQHSWAYKIRANANAGDPTEVAFGQSNADVTKVVSGFVPGFADADGATYKLDLVHDSDPNQALPGGIDLTDTLTFTIDGN